MARYEFQVVDAPHVAGGGNRGALISAYNRSITINKDDISACQWSMLWLDPGTRQRSTEANLIIPRSTDIIVYRTGDDGDAHALFRGRVKASQVNYSEDGDVTADLGAVGYQYLLQRRLIDDVDCTRPTGGGPLTRNYASGQDVASIVWDLLSFTQAKSTLGINASFDGYSTLTPVAMTTTTGTLPNSGTSGTLRTGGSGNSGITRNTILQFNTGTTVYDAIQQLAAGDASTVNSIGFDWDVIPDDDGTLRIHIWSLANGGRGASSGYILDWPGKVASGSTQDDADNYADAIRASGGDTVSAVYLGAAGTDGLYESAASVTVPDVVASVASQTTAFMAAAAAQAFAVLNPVMPSFTENIKPGGWQFGDSDVGDTVTVAVPWFEGGDSTLQLILTQTYTPGDDGGETIAVTLGAPPLFTTIGSAKRQLAQARRIAQLEHLAFGGSA